MATAIYRFTNVKKVIDPAKKYRSNFSQIGDSIRDILEREFKAERVKIPDIYAVSGVNPYNLNNGVTAVSYSNGVFDNLVSLAGNERTVRDIAESISRGLEADVEEVDR